MPLPVRNKLVNPNAQNPLAELQEIKNKEVEHLDNLIQNLGKPGFSVNQETMKKYSHLESIGIKEMKPYKPSDFAKQIQEGMKKSANEEVHKHLEAGREVIGILNNEVVKIKKKEKLNNIEQFLEELHTLIESWNPQATDWPGERRPILYDFECRDEVRKLMIKYGL